MASTISNLLRKEIMRLKPRMQAQGLEGARRAQDALGELGARALQDKVIYTAERFDDFEAEWAYPLDGPAEGVILYLHGGSYSAGSLSYAKGFGGILASTTQRNTLCVGYRLAPEHPFPAALEDAAEAYRRALKKYPEQPVAIVGESAGGGLTFALAVYLKQLGLPQPACLVALSPWTDLTCSAGSYAGCAEVDPCLSHEALIESAGWYASIDLRNPLVSPLFADLSGLAPSLIYCGTYEMLLDDSTGIAANLSHAGASCELHVVDEMWHVFVLYGIPEAREALARIEEFLHEHLVTRE